MDPARIEQLRHVAQVLLPGDGGAPAAADVPDLPALLDRALTAVGGEAAAVETTLDALGAQPDWEQLKAYAAAHPVEFEVLGAVVSGAYFMSPLALDAIGYPHGPRRAPRSDLAADQLSSGVLDEVAARDSMVRLTP